MAAKMATNAIADLDAMTASDLLDGLPPRLHNVYETFVALQPDSQAFLEGERTWTYADFAKAVDDVAQAMRSLGVRGGDRVMIVSENSVIAGVILFAASKLDAWAIVANPRLSPRELDQIYEHSGARRRFFASGISAEAGDHGARCGAKLGALGPFTDIATGDINENATPEPVHNDSAKQVAVLIYTSGTTGSPKGVMLSHRNLMFAAKVSGLLRNCGPEDCTYGVLPMSHIVGLSISLLGSLMFGSSMMMVPKSDPAHLAACLAAGKITILSGVPATYQRLLAYKTVSNVSRIEKGRLRVAGVAGAPLDLALKRRVEQEFGLPLLNGYGITECAPSISGAREAQPCADESVGRIVPGVETRVVAADGKPVTTGEIGELQVRGPNVMLGYYRAKDLTEKAVSPDGWFSTGDLVRFDGANLYIVGRAKEMIIRSGFNVYPAEIEAVINEHASVLQSAVVGRQIEGNEEVVAFVQLVPGANLAASELKAFIEPQLTAYKRPSEIIILDAFPAGSTGKILKHLLKAQANA